MSNEDIRYFGTERTFGPDCKPLESEQRVSVWQGKDRGHAVTMTVKTMMMSMSTSSRVSYSAF